MTFRPANVQFFALTLLVPILACGRMMGTGGGGPAGSPGALPLGAAGSTSEGESEEISSLGSNPGGDIFGGDLGGGPGFQSPVAGGEATGGGLFSPAPGSILGGSPSPGPEGGISLLAPILGGSPGTTDVGGPAGGSNLGAREAAGGSETPSSDQTGDTPQTPDAGGGPVASALPAVTPCAGALQMDGLQAVLTGGEGEGGKLEVFVGGTLKAHVNVLITGQVIDYPVYRGEVSFSSVRPRRSMKKNSLPSDETDEHGNFCKYVMVVPGRDRLFVSAQRRVLPLEQDSSFCDEKPLNTVVTVLSLEAGQDPPLCRLTYDLNALRDLIPEPLTFEEAPPPPSKGDEEDAQKDGIQKETFEKIRVVKSASFR